MKTATIKSAIVEIVNEQTIAKDNLTFCLSENKNQYIDAGGTTKGWYEAMKQAMRDISEEQKDIFADINNRGYIPSNIHLRMRPRNFYEECLPKIELIRP